MTFEEFLRSLGLKPRVIVADGRWRRCPTEDHPRKRNGSYKLVEGGHIGFAQNWAVHDSPVTWRPERQDDAPAFDPAKLERARKEAREKMVRAIEGARTFYESCKPLMGGHPYLESHGLDMTGCYGLKLDPQGWLVVPAYRRGSLMTVQRISPDGDKRFWPGAPVSGASYTINRRNASITVLCEGLATGLAVFAAAPLTRVIVAFNAGNLSRVEIPHAGLTTIACDNDRATELRTGTNPGLIAAREAAEALKCGIAVPTDMQGSDWSDWRQERIAERLENWTRKPHETDAVIRRAVDAQLAAEIQRSARFITQGNHG